MSDSGCNSDTTRANTLRDRPAFPQWSESREPGMTLRDYFAAKALQGYISNTEWMNELGKQTGENVEKLDAVNAYRAYKAADTMLEARDK